MPITALPGISGHSKSSTGRWNATGTKCFAAGVGQAALRGTCSTRSSSGYRYCDQSFISPTGSYKLSQCCEPSSEERSAGKPHATFCGNRRWATASGDPVGEEQSSFLPRSFEKFELKAANPSRADALHMV